MIKEVVVMMMIILVVMMVMIILVVVMMMIILVVVMMMMMKILLRNHLVRLLNPSRTKFPVALLVVIAKHLQVTFRLVSVTVRARMKTTLISVVIHHLKIRILLQL